MIVFTCFYVSRLSILLLNNQKPIIERQGQKIHYLIIMFIVNKKLYLNRSHSVSLSVWFVKWFVMLVTAVFFLGLFAGLSDLLLGLRVGGVFFKMVSCLFSVLYCNNPHEPKNLWELMDEKCLVESCSEMSTTFVNNFSCLAPACFLIYLNDHVIVTSCLPTCVLSKSHAGHKLHASAACGFLHGKEKFSCF